MNIFTGDPDIIHYHILEYFSFIQVLFSVSVLVWISHSQMYELEQCRNLEINDWKYWKFYLVVSVQTVSMYYKILMLCSYFSI